MSKQRKKYGGNDREWCPACHYEEISTEFRGVSLAVDVVTKERDIDYYMLRICQRCGFHWDERPLNYTKLMEKE